MGKAVEDHGKHIIIASEPSTYKESDWHLIPRNSLVTATAEHGVQVASIMYRKEWDAEDLYEAYGVPVSTNRVSMLSRDT